MAFTRTLSVLKGSEALSLHGDIEQVELAQDVPHALQQDDELVLLKNCDKARRHGLLDILAQHDVKRDEVAVERIHSLPDREPPVLARTSQLPN